jgi:type I restriction enzyme R subunit
VNEALKLYGRGGKSSKAIVDHYGVAVNKLSLLLSGLVETLADPSDWAEIKDDVDKKEDFKLAFLEASNQMNLVQQYYEYQWVDEAFGMSEHTWLQYIGAYKNLFPRAVGPGTEAPVIRQLQGKTKLTNTQVIDAAHILSLIGARVGSTDGIQTVDEETKRIIYEQIQELSNMGEAVTADLLREFVETELFTGHLSSSIDFDEAFDKWKKDKLQVEIEEFADFWGIQDKDILIRSLYSYSDGQPEIVPYIKEITDSVNFEIAKNKETKNRLKHIIELGKVLPSWMQEVKSRLS